LPYLFCAVLAAGLSNPGLAASLPEKNSPPPELATEAYARLAEAELRGNILPFWLDHARDRERGGFFGEVTDELKVRKDAPRGALLTARILWTFSAAYRRYHDPAYLEMARWAYDDLLAHFWDQESGGLYWMVSANGKPLDPRKLLYVQSFGIYGLAEFHRATGERAPLDRAIELYRVVESHTPDRQHGGYFEEFARDWKISRARGRGSPMGSEGQKSQNVHLHLLEAYTNLLRVWPDDGLRKNLGEIVAVMRTRMLDPKTHHLRLFLAEDWTPESDTISFGHDIEFSWLLVETAEVLGDKPLLAAVQKEAVEIARATLREGVDPDGGMLAEANPKGITKTFKEWWPQAEAMVGFLNAYQLSGDRTFLDASQRSWNFISTRLVDRKNGEWFQGVSREGGKSGAPKLSFWKCPYHNGRACLEVAERLSAPTR
jgi:mannobiose 2-epimerase